MSRPTEYASQMHEARRTLVLAALALRVADSPVTGMYRTAPEIQLKLRTKLGVVRNVDWIRRYLSDITTTGHADREQILGGWGTHYGWKINDLGRGLLAAQLHLLDRIDPQIRGRYNTALAKSSRR